VVSSSIHRRSSLSVTFFSPSIYLPLVFKNHGTTPDQRFGVAEYTPAQAELLGLAGADYISGQWRLPVEGDTVVFFTVTERDHRSTWLLCSWSPVAGWYDEQGCREWIQKHPGTIYIVGNELTLGSPIGLGDLINAKQYARWYHDARTLILEEDSTATIAPYGPCQDAGGLLISVWNSYQEQFGVRLPADFYPVHFYCQVADEPWWCWTKLTHWIDWLEQHRGTHWTGPRDYWVTEWGLMAWLEPVPQDVALALMDGVIPELRNNTIGISQHAWWPSCLKWPDCTLLIRGGQVTRLGERYLELALAP